MGLDVFEKIDYTLMKNHVELVVLSTTTEPSEHNAHFLLPLSILTSETNPTAWKGKKIAVEKKYAGTHPIVAPTAQPWSKANIETNHFSDHCCVITTVRIYTPGHAEPSAAKTLPLAPGVKAPSAMFVDRAGQPCGFVHKAGRKILSNGTVNVVPSGAVPPTSAANPIMCFELPSKFVFCADDLWVASPFGTCILREPPLWRRAAYRKDLGGFVYLDDEVAAATTSTTPPPPPSTAPPPPAVAAEPFCFSQPAAKAIRTSVFAHAVKPLHPVVWVPVGSEEVLARRRPDGNYVPVVPVDDATVVDLETTPATGFTRKSLAQLKPSAHSPYAVVAAWSMLQGLPPRTLFRVHVKTSAVEKIQ